MKTTIWSFYNMKGGVAKSTSTLNIGTELSETYGLKVLLVDNDPQANLTELLGVESEDLEYTIADVLMSSDKKENIKLEDIVVQLRDNLYLVPSSIELSSADMHLHSVIFGRERVLGNSLKELLSKYHFDVVLIDNQPSMSLLPLNSLSCSDYVIVPCSTEYLSHRGLKLIQKTFEQVRDNLNPNIKMFGVIATKFKKATMHHREILEWLEDNYNVLGVVHDSVKVPDAAYHESGSVVLSSPKTQPAISYKEITEKIYNEIMKGSGKE